MRITLSLIREANGYTIEEASKSCKVSVEVMKKFESDPGSIPASKAIIMRRLYGVPTDYIKID